MTFICISLTPDASGELSSKSSQHGHAFDALQPAMHADLAFTDSDACHPDAGAVHSDGLGNTDADLLRLSLVLELHPALTEVLAGVLAALFPPGPDCFV